MKIDFAGFGEKSSAVFSFVRKHWMLVAALILGVILLCFPDGSEEQTAYTREEHWPEFSLAAEENRIEEALEKIAGTGEITVVLTVKSSVEQRVARDESTQYRTLDGGYELSSESSAVRMQGDGEQLPIVLKYIYPEYKGALVVADGVNAALRLELTNAVAALTGLSTDKISVVAGEV